MYFKATLSYSKLLCCAVLYCTVLQVYCNCTVKVLKLYCNRTATVLQLYSDCIVIALLLYCYPQGSTFTTRHAQVTLSVFILPLLNYHFWLSRLNFGGVGGTPWEISSFPASEFAGEHVEPWKNCYCSTGNCTVNLEHQFGQPDYVLSAFFATKDDSINLLRFYVVVHHCRYAYNTKCMKLYMVLLAPRSLAPSPIEDSHLPVSWENDDICH